MSNRGKGASSSRVTRNQWSSGPGANDLPSTVRFEWDAPSVIKLLESMKEEVMSGNISGGNLSKQGYENIVAEFASVGRSVTPPQLRNKIKSLKRDYTTWNKLKNFDTGLGLTPTGTIDASDEWWYSRIRVSYKLHSLNLSHFVIYNNI